MSFMFVCQIACPAKAGNIHEYESDLSEDSDNQGCSKLLLVAISMLILGRKVWKRKYNQNS